MLKSKQHIFYFTIFSLLNFTYSLQSMEGLGTPDELINLDAALAQQIATFGVGAFAPEEQTKIDKIDSTLDALKKNGSGKRKRNGNELDISLEVHPENLGPRYEYLMKSKHRRIEERRRRRTSVGGSHFSQHPLIEAIGRISFQPSFAKHYYAKAIHILEAYSISQGVLSQALRMAISRGIWGIAYRIYDPQDSTRSLLHREQLRQIFIDTLNARDFELVEKLFEFIADADIFQNALMHVAQRGHVAAVEFLLGLSNCPISACRRARHELRGMIQSTNQNINISHDQQTVPHSLVINDSAA